jgi:hypothetical protein
MHCRNQASRCKTLPCPHTAMLCVAETKQHRTPHHPASPYRDSALLHLAPHERNRTPHCYALTKLNETRAEQYNTEPVQNLTKLHSAQTLPDTTMPERHIAEPSRNYALRNITSLKQRVAKPQQYATALCHHSTLHNPTHDMTWHYYADTTPDTTVPCRDQTPPDNTQLDHYNTELGTTLPTHDGASRCIAGTKHYGAKPITSRHLTPLDFAVTLRCGAIPKRNNT